MTDPVEGAATYAAAGVDIEAGDRAVELIKAKVGRATRPEVVGGLGGFAGLFRIDADRLLATSTDGVGTKVAVAAGHGPPRHHRASTWSAWSSTTSSSAAPSRCS